MLLKISEEGHLLPSLDASACSIPLTSVSGTDGQLHVVVRPGDGHDLGCPILHLLIWNIQITGSRDIYMNTDLDILHVAQLHLDATCNPLVSREHDGNVYTTEECATGGKPGKR